ncbi:Hypothetical predicted protein, partial [Olea europaea subsp. europaea]
LIGNGPRHWTQGTNPGSRDFTKFLHLGLRIINFRINYVRLKMCWTENLQRTAAPG